MLFLLHPFPGSVSCFWRLLEYEALRCDATRSRNSTGFRRERRVQGAAMWTRLQSSTKQPMVPIVSGVVMNRCPFVQ
jgi:hypothetical protein